MVDDLDQSKGFGETSDSKTQLLRAFYNKQAVCKTHHLPSLKLTAKAPENRPSKKETRKSSNHPFSSANLLFVSGRVKFPISKSGLLHVQPKIEAPESPFLLLLNRPDSARKFAVDPPEEDGKVIQFN